MQHQLTSADMAQAGFGKQFAGANVPAYTGTDDNPWLVPINPDYQFDNLDVARILVHAWSREFERKEAQNRKGVYLHGPTGSGKTSVIEQFFARLNVPLIRITWTPKREADDLLHSKTLIDGTLVSIDQAIVQAARNGWPVLINEIDLADPAELVSLNEVVERGLISLPDGSVVQGQRGFIVFCTGNTAGADDEDGIYHGTRPQNAAFNRRFFSQKVDYPSEETELAFLETQLPGMLPKGKGILTASAKCAVRLRQAFEGTVDGVRLSASISRPEVVDWVETMSRFHYLVNQNVPVAEYALGFVFTNRLSAADRTAVNEIIKSHFRPEAATT